MRELTYVHRIGIAKCGDPERFDIIAGKRVFTNVGVE